MNPRLLKRKDLEKCYNRITGTDSKGIVTHKEMEEHFLFLKARFPIETHMAMVGVLQNDDKLFEEGMVPLYSYRPNKGLNVADVARTSKLIYSINESRQKLQLQKEREIQKQAILGLGFSEDTKKPRKKPTLKTRTTVSIGPEIFLVEHTDSYIIQVSTPAGNVIRNDSFTFKQVQEKLFPTTPSDLSWKLTGKPQKKLPEPKLMEYGIDWVLIFKSAKYLVRYLDHLDKPQEKWFAWLSEAKKFINSLSKPVIYEEDFVTLDTGFRWDYN